MNYYVHLVMVVCTILYYGSTSAAVFLYSVGWMVQGVTMFGGKVRLTKVSCFSRLRDMAGDSVLSRRATGVCEECGAGKGGEGRERFGRAAAFFKSTAVQQTSTLAGLQSVCPEVDLGRSARQKATQKWVEDDEANS